MIVDSSVSSYIRAVGKYSNLFDKRGLTYCLWMSQALKNSCHFTIFPFHDNNILVNFDNHKICTFVVCRGTSALLSVKRIVSYFFPCNLRRRLNDILWRQYNPWHNCQLQPTDGPKFARTRTWVQPKWSVIALVYIYMLWERLR